MTRAAIPGLESRYRIGGLLPALYAEDDFAQRFTAGLDTVLAPALSTLDNLPAYLDPGLAPPDFLVWLASWVGIDIDPTWPEELRRAVVGRAVELHRWRGTRRGLAELLRLGLGAGVEIRDGGGARWTTAAAPESPPPATGELLVRAWPVSTEHLDADQVRRIVRMSCPAHLSFEVEILSGPPDAARS
ncbi:phage tail protein [Streptomyces sp. NPDC002564]|uniref:phage tail protein n=1 Tax=Streptomyces sp. NPDC002564 TaxID=3364649 RepID=UPI0036B2D902